MLHVVAVAARCCAGDGIADEFYVTFTLVEGEVGFRILNGTHQFGFDSAFSRIIRFFIISSISYIINDSSLNMRKKWEGTSFSWKQDIVPTLRKLWGTP